MLKELALCGDLVDTLMFATQATTESVFRVCANTHEREGELLATVYRHALGHENNFNNLIPTYFGYELSLLTPLEYIALFLSEWSIWRYGSQLIPILVDSMTI